MLLHFQFINKVVKKLQYDLLCVIASMTKGDYLQVWNVSSVPGISLHLHSLSPAYKTGCLEDKNKKITQF